MVFQGYLYRGLSPSVMEEFCCNCVSVDETYCVWMKEETE